MSLDILRKAKNIYLALSYKEILSGEYKEIIDNLLRKGDTNEI